MSKETIVFISGVLLTITPFLGVPESWRTRLVVALGVVLIFLGYALRRTTYLSRIDKGNGERGTNAFVETTEKLFE
ncbi:MAG: hypothetical protein KBB78_01785 [Candidatus Pacebacteria bacterium]|nr:hypothetical protein [Candidatus Paceibacterota bacterium]MBP6924276.1 hypothetical protein [Candidatus Paceibacterota bacterium]